MVGNSSAPIRNLMRIISSHHPFSLLEREEESLTENHGDITFLFPELQNKWSARIICITKCFSIIDDVISIAYLLGLLRRH